MLALLQIQSALTLWVCEPTQKSATFVWNHIDHVPYLKVHKIISSILRLAAGFCLCATNTNFHCVVDAKRAVL